MESPLDDAQLLRRCRQNDETALAELIRRYEQRLYRVAFRVAGDRALAEEATVDSFYKVWCKARQWRGQTRPEAWLYRITVRTTLDLKRGRLRWRQRKKLASSTNREPEPTPPDILIEDERHARIASELRTAVDSLKVDDQVLIQLYYFEGRGLAEIATVLDTTRDALKMRLARARQHLRRVLEDDNDNSET